MHLDRILLNAAQSLGPCKQLQLAWFLCALETRLPSTGFLLADAKQTSLAKILTSLFQVAGDLESHHSQITSQGNDWKPHVFCEPLGRSLSRAIHHVQSGIDVPDCLLERFIAPGDSGPLAPLVTPSSLLKDAITRYDTLYREHIDQLYSSATGAKPSSNGWICRWCSEWLAGVQGITVKFNWGQCLPRIPEKPVLFQSGASTIKPVAAGHADRENSKNSRALPATGSASTMNPATLRAEASIVNQPVPRPAKPKPAAQPAAPQSASAPTNSPAARPTVAGAQANIFQSQPAPQPVRAPTIMQTSPPTATGALANKFLFPGSEANMVQSQPAPQPASARDFEFRAQNSVPTPQPASTKKPAPSPLIPPGQTRTLGSTSPLLPLRTVLGIGSQIKSQTIVRITEESLEEKRVRDHGYRYSRRSTAEEESERDSRRV